MVAQPGMGTHHGEVEVSVVSETVFGKDDSPQHCGRDLVGSPGDLECVRVNIEDVLTEKSDEKYSEDEPDADDNGGQQNIYVTARHHVQRVIDVTLMINNMSRLSTILDRSYTYEPYQLHLLVAALLISMVGQIIAGVCFFINHDREEDERNAPKPHLDYVAYVCVAIVMVLNIFVSCFDSSWSKHNFYPIQTTGNKILH